MKFTVGIIIGILIGVFLVLFIVQNTAVIEIHLIAWTVSVSRSSIILIVFFAGGLLGWLLSAMASIQRKNKKLNKMDLAKESLPIDKLKNNLFKRKKKEKKKDKIDDESGHTDKEPSLKKE